MFSDFIDSLETEDKPVCDQPAEAGLIATIKPDTQGRFEIEVFNGNGENCLDLTKVLENQLGGVTNRIIKADAKKPKGQGQNAYTSRYARTSR